MSVIGMFTPTKEGGWSGTIRTLTIDAKLRFVPNDNRDSERAPAFKLDDPVLAAPLHAALFPTEGNREAHLVWRRWETT